MKFFNLNSFNLKLEIINKIKSKPLLYYNTKKIYQKIIKNFAESTLKEIISLNKKWLNIILIPLLKNNIQNSFTFYNIMNNYLLTFDKNKENYKNEKHNFLLDISYYCENNKINDIKSLLNSINKTLFDKYYYDSYIICSNNKLLSILGGIKLLSNNNINKEKILIIENNIECINNFLKNFPINFLSNYNYFFKNNLEIFNLLEIKNIKDFYDKIEFLYVLFPSNIYELIYIFLGIGEIYHNKLKINSDFSEESFLYEKNKNNKQKDLIKETENLCVKIYKNLIKYKNKSEILSIELIDKEGKKYKKYKKKIGLFEFFDDIKNSALNLLNSLMNNKTKEEIKNFIKIKICLKNLFNFNHIDNEIWLNEHKYIESNTEKKLTKGKIIGYFKESKSSKNFLVNSNSVHLKDKLLLSKKNISKRKRASSVKKKHSKKNILTKKIKNKQLKLNYKPDSNGILNFNLLKK